jgi:hypothetical protein
MRFRQPVKTSIQRYELSGHLPPPINRRGDVTLVIKTGGLNAYKAKRQRRYREAIRRRRSRNTV